MVFSLDHPIRQILHKSLFLCYFHIYNSLHRMVTIMHLQMTSRTVSMLRITTEKKRGKIFLSVEGRLAGPWVAALEQCWRELHAASPREKFHVNLCGVSFIDAAGKVLLMEIHRQGGQLIAEGCLNQAIVQEIVAREKQGRSNGAKERPKRSHIIFYTAFFTLLLGPTVTSAQGRDKLSVLPGNAPAQVLRLTLDQAVGLALKQNPTAQIAILQAAQSEQDKNIARADLLPQANAKISDEAQKVNLLAQFGGRTPFPGFPKSLGPYQLFSAGPSFGTAVFDLTLWRRYQAARDTVSAGKANSLSTREQVILLVVSQYIGTLRGMANVQASQSRVDLAQALYDQAADLQKEGVGTGIDTLRANVELQNEKQRLIQAQTDRETSLFALSRLLNLDPRQQIELGDSLSFFDTPQPEVEPSIELALAVKTALLKLQSARNEVQVANLGVQLSKEEVDQARDRFKAGVANNIEVIQAQDSLSRANDNQIAALYRFNQARADLARSIGQMEKVYAK